MTVDLAALAKLAAEATPGPWRSELAGDGCWWVYSGETMVCDGFTTDRPPENSAYIATASPDAVAALIRVALAAQTWGDAKEALAVASTLNQWSDAETEESVAGRALIAALEAIR